MTLSINDIKNGSLIVIDGAPYLVILIKHLHMGRGGASVQTKIRNLKTGQVFERNFKPSDEFEEADVEKIKARFLYENRGVCWFAELNNPKNRFSLEKEKLGEQAQYLKANLEITAVRFNNEVIGIELPPKIDYKVIEAAPAVRGNTAQGATKTVVIESGAKITTPLFVNEGDIIRVNVQTGEYAERMEKG